MDPRTRSEELDQGPDGDGVELRSQLVARQLRSAILSGRYAPRERLRQEDIAHEFGISRVPVREALRQLESEGLVTLAPHAGARVSWLDVRELDEVYEIRGALEPMLIARSAVGLSDAQLAHLRELVDELEFNAERPGPWMDLDRKFHLESYAGGDMPRAQGLVEGFWNRTQQYRRAFVLEMTPGQLEVVHLEHRLILDALERRSGEDAASALATHVRRTRQALLLRNDLFAAKPGDEPVEDEDS